MKRLIYFWKLNLLLEWLRKKIVIVITILSLLAIFIGFFGTNHLIDNLIDNQALQQARLSSKILQKSWFSYSQNVVNRLNKIKDIQVVPNYHNLPNAIPNPATYTIELGKSLSSEINGTTLSLFSEYPFPHRRNTGGPQNSFQREAIEYLKIDSSKPFYRREKVKNQDLIVFRYAEGITMQTSCVACHNSLPMSPKKDWQVGDLRGVIEVDQSISDVIIFAEDGMRSVQIIVAIIVSLLAISIMIVVSYLRNYNTLLQQEVQKKTLSLSKLATIDCLTQLANRRNFDDTLKSEWKFLQRKGAALSLLMCDIDFFKQYNDTYGHQAGDKCLQLVAQTIAAGVTRSRDLVARYGGEEFAVILPNTDATNAAIVARGIIKSIRNLNLVHETSEIESYITLSVGIASFVEDKTAHPQDLIKMADDALYQAKKQGRNRFVIA